MNCSTFLEPGGLMHSSSERLNAYHVLERELALLATGNIQSIVKAIDLKGT